MDCYKIVEVKIIECLWSDVYRRYMVNSNPECRRCVVCVLHNSDYWLKHVGENIITKSTS